MSVLARELTRAPLASAAAALTAGILASRIFVLPFWECILAGGASLVAFAVRGQLAPLLCAVACLGAALHASGNWVLRDDVAWRVGPRPVPVVLRGTLDGEPRRLPPATQPNPLFSQPATASATAVLLLTHLVTPDGESPISGRVRLLMNGIDRQPAGQLLAGMHPGDTVEVAGRLERLRGPANPGEFGRAAYWQTQGIRCTLHVRPGAAHRLAPGWRSSFAGWIGRARLAAHDTFDRLLPFASTRPLARALVLGEGAPMRREEWSRYIRTGVIHVLAISGQHLVIVAAFLWLAFRSAGMRQTRAALLIASLLLAYALLTGGRPPALRAAVLSCAMGAALALGKAANGANLFALAWILVVLLKPDDVFDPGCQMSFWAVAVLAWGIGEREPKEIDPLDKLIEQSRSAWDRWLRQQGGMIREAYRVCALCWLAITPLVAWHAGLLAPAALLLGPPLTLLTSVALFFGLLTLGLSWCPPLASLAGWGVHLPLVACDALVSLAETWPVHVRLPPVPGWWMLLFTAILAAWAIKPPTLRSRPWAACGLAGTCSLLPLAWLLPNPDPAGLRCTFVDVGHGGCVVLELPCGRTVVYDAGAIRGGPLAANALTPLLHARGIRRIDDLILSHADLDHFNGVPGLLEHFAVGRVLCSATFAQKRTPGVAFTLAALKKRGVPVRHVSAGTRLHTGEATLDILHPAAGFRGASENARSVVVEVRQGGHSVLLTGDLEGEGLARLLALPPRVVDVLQVPHHGSLRVDLPGLARWCRPALAVSCEGPPRSMRRWALPCPLWTTWEHGAVTLEGGTALRATAHRTGKRLNGLRGGKR